MKNQGVTMRPKKNKLSKHLSIVRQTLSSVLLTGFVCQISWPVLAQQNVMGADSLQAPPTATLKTSLLSLSGASASLPVLASVQAMAQSMGLKPEFQQELQQQLLSYLSSILNVNVLQVVQSKKISPVDIKDLSVLGTQPQELYLLLQWATLINQNKLASSLDKIIQEVKKSSSPQLKSLQAKLNAMSDLQLQTIEGMLVATIESVTKMRGLTLDSKGQSYSEWTSLSKTMQSRLDQDLDRAHLLSFSQSSWSSAENLQILVNGEASFEKRDLLMAQATESIHILTWSVYDDVTGKELVDLLIKKKTENSKLDIRLIVDGQVAMTAGHHEQIDRLKEFGIPVIRWFSASRTYMGQHRKMMIVDGKHLIAGGLNFGDVYSHKNPKSAQWRDTDVYFQGPAVLDGEKLFAEIWNDQLQEPHMKNIKLSSQLQMAVPSTASTVSGMTKISLINHDPRQSLEGSTIMMTILKMIRQAKTSIDIENAYVILFPALADELKQAIQRHVQVRVLTNSSQSVDEPVVSIPILRSARQLSEMGAQVYLKKGTNTLHSKFLVVDQDLAMVMSYNLHPRSERVEGEMVVLVDDRQFSQQLTQVFEKDIQSSVAQEIHQMNEVEIPDSAVCLPSLRIFFDLL